MGGLAITRRAVLAAVTAPLLWPLIVPSAAYASCVEMSEAEQRDRADVVFEGRALPGPETDGSLLTPARFEVEEYLEGDGPDVVDVVTASRDEGGGIVSHVSVGVSPRAGETWRIYARRPTVDGPLETSECDGSVRLSDAPTADAGGSEPAADSDPRGGTAPVGGTDAAGSTSPVLATSAILVVAIVTLAAVLRPARRGHAPGPAS
jgi:hypothetical protein